MACQRPEERFRTVPKCRRSATVQPQFSHSFPNGRFQAGSIAVSIEFAAGVADWGESDDRCAESLLNLLPPPTETL